MSWSATKKKKEELGSKEPQSLVKSGEYGYFQRQTTSFNAGNISKILQIAQRENNIVPNIVTQPTNMGNLQLEITKNDRANETLRTEITNLSKIKHV